MRKTSIAVAAAFALLISACGGGGYNRSDAIDDLTEAGMTQAQAECVVDEAEDTFGLDKLNSDDEPTAEEQEQIIAITTECMAE